MNSPFPGVDPYIEDQHYWPDFHATFIPFWREAIRRALPPDYEARIDERMQIVELDRKEEPFVPDVAVVHDAESSRRPKPEIQQAKATVEAVVLDLPAMEEVRERWIEILHRPERRVVALLELLSPTNKTGDGRARYLLKRAEIFNQPVHFVEVDLLLTGERLPMRQPLPSGDFYAIVSRHEKPRKGGVYAWTLRDRLPEIPIPLLKPDGDIFVDLGEVFARAFESGAYADSVKYASPLTLPLKEETRRWAQGIGANAAVSS